MSDLGQRPEPGGQSEQDPPSKGPNLVLIYSLIAFALISAIFLAGLIVLPFYRRR
jgi:hypothetical protein